MNRFFLLSLIFILAGCATVQMPGYISRADHPYDRKFLASFEKVVGSVIYVLKKQGWGISEADPSIYERDDRYDDNGYRNLLIITDVKRNYRVVSSTFTHLNVFIHAMGNVCYVEIRYEARTPLIKEFSSFHNDQKMKLILDAVEEDIKN